MELNALTPMGRTANAAMNGWIHGEVQSLAGKLGIDTVPMVNPDFNFYGYTESLLKNRGYRGLILEEKTNETIQRLLFDMRNGGPGPLLRQYDGSSPFDEYYKKAVQRRALSELRDDKKQREKLPTVNIKPSGKDEVTPGIAEDTLGELAEGPNDEYFDQTLENLFGYLSRARAGDLLSLIFRLMVPEPAGSGFTQSEVAKYLNSHQVPSETGQTEWSPGMVNSNVAKIRKVVEQYIRDEDLGEGGEGILKALMGKPAPKPVGPRVPKEPKGPRMGFYHPNGTTDPERIQVKILRSNLHNTTFLLPDGTRKKVPTELMDIPR